MPGRTFQFPIAFIVAEAENQSLGRETNRSAVRNSLREIGQRGSMANSTELELLGSPKLAWISNGQPLLCFPQSDGFDMFLARAMAALALDSCITLLNRFRQSFSLTGHMTSETFF